MAAEEGEPGCSVAPNTGKTDKIQNISDFINFPQNPKLQPGDYHELVKVLKKFIAKVFLAPAPAKDVHGCHCGPNSDHWSDSDHLSQMVRFLVRIFNR